MIREKPCTICKGERTLECIRCIGTGRIPSVVPIKRVQGLEDECPLCGGTGRILCATCEGTGYITYIRTRY